MNNWIALDENCYINKAIEYSSNIDYLNNLRKNLRNIIINSDICNGKKFANNLEILFDTILIK
jgi:predicted O-linked N-acetylglucosamine transferase (SPINDLY family)